MKDNRKPDEVLVAEYLDGDQAAGGELIDRHKCFIWKTVNRYHRCATVDREDLFQEGAMGLLHAATRFDPDRGVKFLSYAAWWIWNRIKFTTMEDGVIRMPRSSGRWANSMVTASLDQPIGGGGSSTMVTLVRDRTREIEQLDAKLLVEVVMETLTPRERFVLRGRAEGRTLGEIGSDLGVTKERVRQIEKEARNIARDCFPARSQVA